MIHANDLENNNEKENSNLLDISKEKPEIKESEFNEKKSNLDDNEMLLNYYYYQNNNIVSPKSEFKSSFVFFQNNSRSVADI